jgi:hypothetical protein
MYDLPISEVKDRPPYKPRDDMMEKLCGKNWMEKVVIVTHQAGDTVGEAVSQEQNRVYRSFMLDPSGMLQVHQSNSPCSGSTAWKVLRPLVDLAFLNRRDSLNEELQSLKSLITTRLYSRIDTLIHTKMDFMQQLSSRLGQTQTIVTEEESRWYQSLNQHAVALWERVKYELEIPELERVLSVGGIKQDDLREEGNELDVVELGRLLATSGANQRNFIMGENEPGDAELRCMLSNGASQQGADDSDLTKWVTRSTIIPQLTTYFLESTLRTFSMWSQKPKITLFRLFQCCGFDMLW